LQGADPSGAAKEAALLATQAAFLAGAATPEAVPARVVAPLATQAVAGPAAPEAVPVKVAALGTPATSAVPGRVVVALAALAAPEAVWAKVAVDMEALVAPEAVWAKVAVDMEAFRAAAPPKARGALGVFQGASAV
jgi:hypothetical protein